MSRTFNIVSGPPSRKFDKFINVLGGLELTDNIAVVIGGKKHDYWEPVDQIHELREMFGSDNGREFDISAAFVDRKGAPRKFGKRGGADDEDAGIYDITDAFI